MKMNRVNIKFRAGYNYIAKDKGCINHIYDGGFNIDYDSSLHRACNHRDSVVFLSAKAVSEKFKKIGNIGNI